jgi:hypothetical protein
MLAKFMYIYYRTTNGFNDILSRLLWLLPLCNLTNRTLLLDGARGTYNLDFSMFFTLPTNIIHDTATIDAILDAHPMVVFPAIRPPKDQSHQTVHDVALTLGTHPLVSFKEVRYYRCSYQVFQYLSFKPSVNGECARRLSSLPKKYIGIHVRNTDRKSNYIQLYRRNKKLIHSYPAVYLATDCKEALDFFKAKMTNVKNCTAFPSDWKPLHLSELSNTHKFMDMICDLYLIAMADKMLSNSKGGFTKLMAACNRNKGAVAVQFGSKTISQ